MTERVQPKGVLGQVIWPKDTKQATQTKYDRDSTYMRTVRRANMRYNRRSQILSKTCTGTGTPSPPEITFDLMSGII